ncbi:SGNH/GDSL hydrolase family protein [Paenibacillus physcomitrellae]|uniref:Lipase n=1 Tax=Paenibacillus physcomitrellae TaxID=1619311 RepID=A0ABQ1GBA8_9BACL|nr:SGNH/GDSL hydrolase family protein [Paenibacillus physcomitrellae]GGA40348.1 lipase [Paenibacillus physcomitrellae]
MSILENRTKVLFIGDSVTDCGRNYGDPASLGSGYAFIAAAEFGRLYPEKQVTFVNKGISGNRVIDLEGRWEKDCLQLKPDYVSILIGINDTWRRYDQNDPTSLESYKEGYRRLIEKTLEQGVKKLIIMEPFVVPVIEEQQGWYEDLNPKIQAARTLAKEFGALYVPLDGLFNAASAQTGAAYWAEDGVHPSVAGHGLIADAWLRTVGAK